jgi:hypothetical protein
MMLSPPCLAQMKEDALMDPVTIEHRKKELAGLLLQIQNQPSRNWTQERQRIVVLQQMIEADERRRTPV